MRMQQMDKNSKSTIHKAEPCKTRMGRVQWVRADLKTTNYIDQS